MLGAAACFANEAGLRKRTCKEKSQGLNPNLFRSEKGSSAQLSPSLNPLNIPGKTKSKNSELTIV
jgi:hypothetical protein